MHWMNESFIYLKSGTFVNDKYLYKEGKSALIGYDNMLPNSLVQTIVKTLLLTHRLTNKSRWVF